MKTNKTEYWIGPGCLLQAIIDNEWYFLNGNGILKRDRSGGRFAQFRRTVGKELIKIENYVLNDLEYSICNIAPFYRNLVIHFLKTQKVRETKLGKLIL